MNNTTFHIPCIRATWKILKFRRCESASEAFGDHYNICGNWSLNSSRIVVSRSPFPSETAFVFEALPQNSLFNLGAADLSERSMYAGCEAVIHTEMYIASK